MRDGEDGLLVDPTDVARSRPRPFAAWRPTNSCAGGWPRFGHGRVRDFSWPTVTRHYREVYEAVVPAAYPSGAPAHAIMAAFEEESTA